MRESDFKEKVTVFISSNIDEKHRLIREALRILLLQTGMCDVYSFEEEPATTTDVVSSYLYRIERADLVVFLINNADGVNAGTLKEVKRSRELKKKCIFLFCNETEKIKTELQNEIMTSPTGEKYKEVPMLSHMAEEAYLSVLGDIVDIYLRYCRNNFQLVEANYLLNSEDQENEVVGVNSVLKKDSYHGYEYLNSIIITYALYNNTYSGTLGDFETESGELLELLLGNIMPDEIDYSLLKKAILERYSNGNLKKLVSHRLDALESHFKGELEDTVSHLTKALEKAQKAKNIPQWIKNDVAIDLRNTAIEIDRHKNVIRSQYAGQDILDQSDEPVYFPLVDRATSSFFENAFDDSLQRVLESPFAIKLGGIDHSLSSIVDLYVAALMYGAITHVILVREKLCKYLQYLSFKNRSHRTFVSAVELLLLNGDNNNLERYVETYGESTDLINETDILVWKNAVETIGIKYKRMNSEILLLSMFGYYFSDAQFSEFFEDIKARIRVWTDELYAGDLIAKAYLRLLTKIQNRINSKELIDTAYLFRRKRLRRWYDDVFKMLGELSINDLSQEVLNNYIIWLIDCCGDSDINTNGNLPNAIQTLRLQKNDVDDLDKAVQLAFPKYYEDTYSLNVFEHDERELLLYLEKQINSIQIMNAQQNNGQYSDKVRNLFITAGNIIRECYDSITNDEWDKICEEIITTLDSDKHSFESKISSVVLLCEIAILSGSEESVKKAIVKISENKEDFQKSINAPISREYNEHLYLCTVGLLEYVTNELSDIELVQHLAMASGLEEAGIIIYLKILNRLLLDLAIIKKKIRSLFSLLQFLFELAKSQNKNIRCWAFICMIDVINLEPSYTEVVLDIVSKAMDAEVYETKVAIISRIIKMDQGNSKVAFIIAKGKVDNHYCVREISNG